MKIHVFVPALMLFCFFAFGRQNTSPADESKAEKKITYYENGAKKSEGILKNGKYEGPYVEWHANGAKSEEGQYKNGKIHGLWLFWYDDGKPRGKGEYENGTGIGTHVFWHKSGVKQMEVSLKNGKFHGTYREYNPDGKLLEEVEFNEGVRDGAFTWWHENGKKAIAGRLRNDKRTGQWISWDQNGEKFTEREYKDDVVVAENKELNARSLANTRPTYEIMTPRGYSADKKYPLVLVLHSGRGSILHDKTFWKADQLKKLPEGFIFAFLQSSQVFETNCYNWDDPEKARKDIRELYDQIIQKYPVDTNQVILMGMVQGGQIAIDAAIRHTVPARGFFVCRPSKLQNLDKDAVKRAALRGVRGTILTGEADKTLLAVSEEMSALFKEVGLVHRYIVIPEMGPPVPLDSTEQFKTAAAHIVGQ